MAGRIAETGADGCRGAVKVGGPIGIPSWMENSTGAIKLKPFYRGAAAPLQSWMHLDNAPSCRKSRKITTFALWGKLC